MLKKTHKAIYSVRDAPPTSQSVSRVKSRTADPYAGYQYSQSGPSENTVTGSMHLASSPRDVLLTVFHAAVWIGARGSIPSHGWRFGLFMTENDECEQHGGGGARRLLFCAARKVCRWKRVHNWRGTCKKTKKKRFIEGATKGDKSESPLKTTTTKKRCRSETVLVRLCRAWKIFLKLKRHSNFGEKKWANNGSSFKRESWGGLMGGQTVTWKHQSKWHEPVWLAGVIYINTVHTCNHVAVDTILHTPQLSVRILKNALLHLFFNQNKLFIHVVPDCTL